MGDTAGVEVAASCVTVAFGAGSILPGGDDVGVLVVQDEKATSKKTKSKKCILFGIRFKIGEIFAQPKQFSNPLILQLTRALPIR